MTESKIIKILVVSDAPLSDQNSFGNTFANIFSECNKYQFGNIYCKPGHSNVVGVSRFFQITEKSLLKNLIDKNSPSGAELEPTGTNVTELSAKERRWFDFLRIKRWIIFFWLREIIWIVGRWDSRELDNYIRDFSPDLIFQPLYGSGHLNRIALRIKNKADVPMICYVSDDVYSLRQFSFSPLFWLDRLYKRHLIKKVVDACDYIFSISDVQKEFYKKKFGKPGQVLTKSKSFTLRPGITKVKKPLKLVYAGNIQCGRWKTLAKIVSALKEINNSEELIQLYIYSQSPVNDRIIKSFSAAPGSYFMGSVSQKDLEEIYIDADVLLHVESFELKERLMVYQSFSTKLVDYFYQAKCILAVGPADVASMKHLKMHDAAIIVNNEYKIPAVLHELINGLDIVEKYARNSWQCGRDFHDRQIMTQRLTSVVDEVLKSRRDFVDYL